MLVRRGEQIRQAMVRAGLSQVELAQTLGISQGNLHKILTGERPGTKLLHKIAEACGLSAHTLSNPPVLHKSMEVGTRRIVPGRTLAALTSTADEAYILADLVAERVVKRLIVEAAGMKSSYRRGHHDVVICIVPRKSGM